jgi:hypothetical protein
MRLPFPSSEFDAAVAAVLHGCADEAQMRSLNEVLRADPAARDEYLFRVELHSRLASDPDLFASAPDDTVAADADNMFPLASSVSLRDGGLGVFRKAGEGGRSFGPAAPPRTVGKHRWAWSLAAAASLVLLLGLGLARWFKHPGSRDSTSTAVAVLAHAADVEWSGADGAYPVGTALEPGWLRLKSGLVQVVFYSGARVVIEGPAELRLLSPREAFCQSGVLSAEVPAQARGFRIGTPQGSVVDLGTAFGLNVRTATTEVHVFKGEVEVSNRSVKQRGLKESEAVTLAAAGTVQTIPVNASLFARASDLLRNSLALQALRYGFWRTANARLNADPSLLVHLDLEGTAQPGWTLPNAAGRSTSVPDATIVGCQWTEGRWPGKRALGFSTISDRVRLVVPGEFQALTLSAWVNVKGLDRMFNSLFMADGFDPGEIHWQVRNDGSLDLCIKGATPKEIQVFASPPVIGLEQFGQWVHLAAVVDGLSGQTVHYLNGEEVSRHPLKLTSPLRVGGSELGNWNIGSPRFMSPALIRHFSGSMDEFALFNRALSGAEIRQLHAGGNPNVLP